MGAKRVLVLEFINSASPTLAESITDDVTRSEPS